MKYWYLIIILFISSQINAQQLKGVVLDSSNQPIPNTNVFIENTYFWTTTNGNGYFEIDVTTHTNKNIVLKHLGYQTKKESIKYLLKKDSLTFVLKTNKTTLQEVIVNSGENPAIQIVKNAIKTRKKNLAKILSYKADFYSKGLWEVKNVPKKILGQEVGDLDGALDSTRSGIVYLSETVSKIAYRAPDEFKEKIIASKVSGDDNGFSFNSALDFNNSFYNNTLNINLELVSPIADFAFNYYTYKLENVFFEENGFSVNKIKVTPKRPLDNVFYGYIFIIDDSWELYGVDLNITGKSIKAPVLEQLNFKQNFTYNSSDKFWVLFSQSFRFSWKIFGISGSGNYVASYKNYQFNPEFPKKFFSKEIISFTPNANYKDSLFWNKIRPLPLTDKETSDYKKRDSIQLVRNSKVYKDSIDKANNKFKITDPLFGYNWQNSSKNTSFNYSGIFALENIGFNTVQGFNFKSNFNFTKKDTFNSYNRFWTIGTNIKYGLSDKRLRPEFYFTQKLNNFTKAYLDVRGGIKATEINTSNTTSNLIFSLAAIFFEENFLKLYDRLFVEATYTQEIVNGLSVLGSLSYQRRKALINSRNNQVFNNDNGGFTANNPLVPNAFGSILFPTHHLLKVDLKAKITFGQTYTTTPRGKYNTNLSKYPVIRFHYQKGFGATVEGYGYDFFNTSLRQKLSISRFGDFRYNVEAGFFLQEDNMSFLDYKHFNGNETRVNYRQNLIRKFFLLPYYDYSTNKSHVQWHFEHDFNGFIMNKLPIIKQLNSSLLCSAKSLWIHGVNPYHEVSLGLGRLGFNKFRFLRFDYVMSYNNGWQNPVLMFGISF